MLVVVPLEEEEVVVVLVVVLEVVLGREGVEGHSRLPTIPP